VAAEFPRRWLRAYDEKLVQSFTIKVEADGRLVAAFRGHLGADDGKLSAEQFARLLQDAPAHVAFDVREMESYASGARVAWQSTLWPVRDKLRSIEVRGGNAIVKMGAAAIGLFLGVPVRYVE
jgi:hypothetical protein